MAKSSELFRENKYNEQPCNYLSMTKVFQANTFIAMAINGNIFNTVLTGINAEYA